jgi:hypothetical protein
LRRLAAGSDKESDSKQLMTVSHNPASSAPPTVLILAGGSVNERLRHLGLRAQTPALLPVHTRPLVAYVLEYYLTQEVGQIMIAVQAEYVSLVEMELIQHRGRFSLVPLPPTKGVVESLRYALSQMSSDETTCIVNVVTTIPDALVGVAEVLVDVKPVDSSVVSTIEFGPDGTAFFLKNEPSPATARAFTGVFALGLGDLRRAAAAASRIDDLLAVVRAAPVEWTCRETAWVDCGHEVNFYDARAQLIASRSFNRLVIDRDRGIVRKRSAAQAKLRDEANYLQALPSSVSILFPRLVSPYQQDGATGEYAMEYYGYPNVAEYLLYWDLSPALWRRMFAQFGVVLRHFSGYRAPLPAGAFEDFYVRRSNERIEGFLRSAPAGGPVHALASGKWTVNGVTVRPLADLLNEVQRLALAGPAHSPLGGIMHGDFCFNNILYDVASGVVRLIDPRGRFGSVPGIHGDGRYDLAKLMHSAVGKYDLIVNGLYEIRADAEGVWYSLGQRAACAATEAAMQELLVDLKADERVIRALMGLLFVTMPPLHTDSTSRQLVFFAHGLQILTEAFN